jgi:rubrerythrin
MEQNTKQLIELLMQGVQDEMNSAYNYIALAGRHGKAELKQAFLQYASEELKHAQKLMRMLQQLGAVVEDVPVVLDEMDDLYLYLIEYMAREESAVFYYEALSQLMPEPEVQQLCREMRGEEQMHLNGMKALLQQVKEQG